jgi:phytoene desaturase
MTDISKSSILVIGAGLGGIVSAARLAKAGYRVTVLEKNSQPGGRCNQIIQDGHRFDVGPTLYLLPSIFRDTYAFLGKEVTQELDLRRIDPTYQIRWNDGSDLALTANLVEIKHQLEAIEQGSFGGLLRYLAEGNQNYRLSLGKLIGRNFFNFFEYFNPANLLLIFQAKALIKHFSNMKKYFKNPRLQATFTFQDMYLGVSPFDAPATYSLLQYSEIADGVWYPMGGMYALVQNLVKIAQDLGVEFHYQTSVGKIEVKDQHVTGVLLENGKRMSADLILANADLPYVYRNLLPEGKESQRLQHKKYTCSTIMFYWGTSKIYSQLGHHNIFLSDDYKGSFEQIFNHYKLPNDPSFYIHAPARTDPSSAPEGQDTLFVLVPVGHLNDEIHQDWSKMVADARQAIFHRLAKMGIDDIQTNLKFEIIYTPKDWQSLYNLEKGNTFGLSHNFTQMGYLRPQNRHRKWKNLYFVGSSTHPGGGLPMAILSAKLVTERIIAGR